MGKYQPRSLSPGDWLEMVGSGRSGQFQPNDRFVLRGHSTWPNVRSHQYRTFKSPKAAQIERQLTAKTGHLSLSS